MKFVWFIKHHNQIPISIQYKLQLPREHTTHAAAMCAWRYLYTYLSLPVRFSLLGWVGQSPRNSIIPQESRTRTLPLRGLRSNQPPHRIFQSSRCLCWYLSRNMNFHEFNQHISSMKWIYEAVMEMYTPRGLFTHSLAKSWLFSLGRHPKETIYRISGKSDQTCKLLRGKSASLIKTLKLLS